MIMLHTAGSTIQGRNVLKKEPLGKEINEDDVFSFNEEFHNKLYKIKIATVSAQKESEPEKQETRHKVSYCASHPCANWFLILIS